MDIVGLDVNLASRRRTRYYSIGGVGGNLFCRKISPPEGEGQSGPLSLKSKDPLPPPGHVIH